MNELYQLLYMTLLGLTMCLLFLDSRYSMKKTAATVYAVAAVLMILLWMLHPILGMEKLKQLYTLLVHVPTFLLLCFFSRCHGWRLVFQLLSAVLFSMLIQHGAMFSSAVFGGGERAPVVTYILLSAAVIWFLVRCLRPLFLSVLSELNRGWMLMCLIMAGHYAICLYLLPAFFGWSRSRVITQFAVTLLMVGFYATVMVLFTSVKRESELRHNTQLAAMRLSALQSRIEAADAAEERVRIERHDLRHRLELVREMVRKGETDAALEFLDTARRHLDESRTVRWCGPPVLDAVFASYFEQAKAQHIRVDARIAFPDPLPVDEGELAMVFANALENAIHTCATLPEEQRRLSCTVIARPSLMLEITNPCREIVTFSAEGLPTAQKEGHGFGTRSIAAFCQKYGAVYRFEQTEGLFTLRVIL